MEHSYETTLAENLIETVKEYPILYNKTTKGYSNNDQRNQLWQSIAALLEFDGTRIVQYHPRSMAGEILRKRIRESIDFKTHSLTSDHIPDKWNFSVNYKGSHIGCCSNEFHFKLIDWRPAEWIGSEVERYPRQICQRAKKEEEGDRDCVGWDICCDMALVSIPRVVGTVHTRKSKVSITFFYYGMFRIHKVFTKLYMFSFCVVDAPIWRRHKSLWIWMKVWILTWQQTNLMTQMKMIRILFFPGLWMMDGAVVPLQQVRWSLCFTIRFKFYAIWIFECGIFWMTITLFQFYSFVSQFFLGWGLSQFTYSPILM